PSYGNILARLSKAHLHLTPPDMGRAEAGTPYVHCADVQQGD
ncbi:unnamed protein product, partial [marine sediment metagenome]